MKKRSPSGIVLLLILAVATGCATLAMMEEKLNEPTFCLIATS